MLTPQQITALRDRAGQITDPIVDYLIADIAERVSEAGQITSTAAYQAWSAQKLGVSQKALKQELRKRLKLTGDEINQMFEQAAQLGYTNDMRRLGENRAVSFEENTTLQQILDTSAKMAGEDFENITQTMGFVGPDGRFDELTGAYQRTCDFAFEKVANGAQDYSSVVREATKELAKQGIRVMDFESGMHTSMEAAVRRNIMGGLGLMNEQITQHNHDAFGADGWEISAHGGSAPDHEPYQGKQYSDKEYERLNNSLVRRIGTLNCGHSAMPIILGVNEPQYTKAELEEFRQQNEEGVTYEGKHYTLYEATQRQRKLESSIRNRKRRILIDEKLGDKDALQTDQIRLQVLRQEYSRFSKAADLPMQHARMEAAGFDWKKGKAAENANTLENNGLLDRSAKTMYNTKADRAQYDKYRLVLCENAPESFAEFQKLKYGDPEKWEDLKKQYRTVNRYEVRGNVKTESVLHLDAVAWKEKQSGFSMEGLTGKAKKKVKDLTGNGNAAAMSLDGKTYFAHSRISRSSDPGFYEYNGEHPLITLKENRRFAVLDLGDGVPRYHDTEAKFLEYVADMKDPADVFDVTILSEKHICKSCEHVVKQFREMFPNATVNIVSGKPGYNKSPEGLKTWKHRKKVKTNG